jgi:serine/threonine protein phosphatase PrpC
MIIISWYLSSPMTRIHFAALSERWSSAENHDSSVAEKIGDFYLFGVAEGLSNEPGRTSASGIAISSLVDTVRKMKGSPAAALNTAVRESEERIHAQVARSPESSRDATHLSACIVSDALECTVLDTGEGNILLLGDGGIVIPRDHPKARYPADAGITLPAAGKEKQFRDMISHTLGEPHMLKQSDFVTVSIRDLFLVISSGGLHDFVRKERIAEIVLANGENVETSAEQLVREAQRSGSEETITVVIAHGHLH